MQEVRINRHVLIVAVTENRDKHIKEADEAKTIYKVAVVNELQKLLDRAKAGEANVPHGISLPIPQDHRREYDRVIRMLEMSADDTITLEQHEFTQYVLDEWQWKAAFTATNMAYSGTLHP